MRPTGLLILLTVLLGHPTYSQPTAPAIPEPPDHVAARAKRLNDAWADLNRRLEKPVSLSPVEVPLERVANQIAEQIEAPLQIDAQALTDEGISIDLPVTMHIDGLAAEEAFHALERHGVTVTIDGTSLLLTTQMVADETKFVRVYPVGDIVVFEQDGKTLVDFTQLMNLIQNVTTPWFDVDGVGGTMRPMSVGDAHLLVVKQTEKVHREIEKLFYDVRQAAGGERDDLAATGERPAAVAETPIRSSIPKTPDYVAARAKRLHDAWADLNLRLEKPVSLSLVDIPLERVAKEIAGQIEAPLRIDAGSLTDEGISLEAPVTIQLDGLAAEEAFRGLETRGVTIAVDGTSLVLTTRAAADEMQFIRVYPVSDVVVFEQDGKTLVDFTQLREMIKNVTRPWFDIDGIGGTILPSSIRDSHMLVVWQSTAVHKEVEKLLYDLRHAANTDHVELPIPADRSESPVEAPQAIGPAINSAVPDTPDYVSARVDRIGSARRAYQHAMALDVDVTFDAMPLRDAIELLLKKTGLPIDFSEAEMAREKIDLQVPVTVTFRHWMLEEAVDELLGEHGFEHARIGSRIVVFPASGCSIGLDVVRFYPVDDLIVHVEADGRTRHDSSQLEDVLQYSTKPWFEIDGVGGTIKSFNAGGQHLLAIRQIETVHEEIEGLLYRIRQAKSNDRDVSR